MPNFNTALDFQHTFAIRAGIAGQYVANVGNLKVAAVAQPVNAGQVITITVSAAGKVT